MNLREFYVVRLKGYLLSGILDNIGAALRDGSRNPNLREQNDAVPRRLFGDDAGSPERQREWWEKPGLGLMYQIEARPGWQWQRNYDRFNASLRGEDGRLRFEGPSPRMSDWVAFSKRLHCDYHMFESKWHDGICYWDTPQTEWKTPVDFCREFADASREAALPFGFYYSASFDHNPDFDDIQPLRCATASYLAKQGESAARRKSLQFTQIVWLMQRLGQREIDRRGGPGIKRAPFYDHFRLNDFRSDPDRYKRYVLAQLDELCGKYGAQLIWTDWYGGDRETASDEIMEFMETRYPQVALAFNASIFQRVRWAHFLSFETHTVPSAWKQGNNCRNLKRPWELVSPAALSWDVLEHKRDPLENAITAAMIMASGGKLAFGVAFEMDGTVRQEVKDQLELLGDWYGPRKRLFVDARPMAYQGRRVPGVALERERTGVMGAMHGGDRLLHIFDLGRGRRNGDDAPGALTLRLEPGEWPQVERVLLEPERRELDIESDGEGVRIPIPPEAIDPVDTILRVCG